MAEPVVPAGHKKYDASERYEDHSRPEERDEGPNDAVSKDPDYQPNHAADSCCGGEDGQLYLPSTMKARSIVLVHRMGLLRSMNPTAHKSSRQRQGGDATGAGEHPRMYPGPDPS